MQRHVLAAGWIVLALLLPACSSEQQGDSKSAGEQPGVEQEATAWWKTEGEGGAAAGGATAALTGSPKEGWTKLAAIDAGFAGKGAKAFEAKGCAACHSVGKGTVVGPDLLGVTHRVEPDWLSGWLKNPEPYLEKDEYAKGMLTKYLVKMPNLNLSDDEIRSLSEFFRQNDAAPQKG
jgi:mono/diheme cytochrome c family protein